MGSIPKELFCFTIFLKNWEFLKNFHQIKRFRKSVNFDNTDFLLCGSPAYLFYSTNTTISPLYDHVENIQKKRSNQMYVGVVPTNRPFYSSSLSLLFLFCTLPGRELGWIDMMCGFFLLLFYLFVVSIYKLRVPFL